MGFVTVADGQLAVGPAGDEQGAVDAVGPDIRTRRVLVAASQGMSLRTTALPDPRASPAKSQPRPQEGVRRTRPVVRGIDAVPTAQDRHDRVLFRDTGLQRAVLMDRNADARHGG